MRAKVTVIGMILLVVASLAVAGCGGSSPGISSTTGPASSTTTMLATTTTGGATTTVGATTTAGATTSSVAGSTTSLPSTTSTRPTPSTTQPGSTTSTTSTAALDSGITGLVTIGPISPVERPGVPNEKPYVATIVIKRTDGTVVTQVRSGDDGRFTVKLPPGDYVLEPRNGEPLPRAETQQVAVSPHTFTEVTVAYDSGIR